MHKSNFNTLAFSQIVLVSQQIHIHNSILGNTEEAYVSLSWRVVDPPSVHWREQTNESMD